jgi:hypothetical protein
MSNLLIIKCNMSNGTMKYSLKAHVYYIVFLPIGDSQLLLCTLIFNCPMSHGTVCYLYSLPPDFYILENKISIGT